MKKSLVVILLLICGSLYAQFKNEEGTRIDLKDKMINNNPSSLFLGFINPANFSMHHSFSMSYSASGSQGIALGVYTNSIGYKFSDKLNIRIDASLINSPYSTFGSGYSQQINGIYLSRAELNYRPSENTRISIQFRQLPGGYYGTYNYYDDYSPFLGNSFFNER